MKKIQKYVSVFMMVAMLAIGLFSFVGAVAAQGPGTLTTDDLGMSYPRAIGLGSTDLRITVATVIKYAMGLLGILAVVIILIGGFTWMTAGGNEEKVGTAKKWIFSGIIGLAIVLCAYAIATYVINLLVTATTTGASGVTY